MNSEEAVVVPLVPLHGEASTEELLRMLLDREALVITRHPGSGTRSPSGMVAQSTGAFAKAIAQAVGQIGRSASNEGLFRVILPTGSVVRDLVPAVGGGFRGMVRAAGSTKIAGSARIVPAAAGAGAAVAAGPLIATVGLAIAGEMLTQHQVNKKLESIKGALAGIQLRFEEQDRSILTTAGQQARKIAGYLLDQANLPAISSASHAFGDLDGLTNIYVERLDRWTRVVEKSQGSDRVYAPDLMVELVGRQDDPIWEFEKAVVQTYEALALRARVVVLEQIAAEFSNPDRSLPHVENLLRDELLVLADRQVQLVGLLDDLSATHMDSSKIPFAFAGGRTLSVRTSFGRLARALHASPDGLPVLTESNHTVLELAPSPRGLSVVTPAAG